MCGSLGVHPLGFAQKVVDPADALCVPGFVLGQRPKKHFVASQRVCTITLHQIIRGLHVVFGLRHFLHLVATQIGAVVFEQKFSVGELRTPLPESFQIQAVDVHQVNVHVQALRVVGLSLAVRHKLGGPLDAVHEAGPSQDHSLVDHSFEGLIKPDVSSVKKEFGPKPRIQQMARGVFGTPDVQIHLAPVVAFLPRAEFCFVVRVHVAQEVPAAPSPSRHGVGLHGLTSPYRPVFTLGPGQGRLAIFCGQVSIHLGKGHGGVRDAMGHATFVHDGEGLAPITLPAEDRISDAVVDGAGPTVMGFNPIQRFGDGFFSGQPAPIPTLGQDGLFVGACRFRQVHPLKDVGNGKVKMTGKPPISFISRGHGHDGARPISRENVIGDPDRYSLFCQRMPDVSTSEYARDGFVALPVPLGLPRCRLLVGLNILALCLACELSDQGVLGCKHHEGHSVEGVRPCREHLHLFP